MLRRNFLKLIGATSLAPILSSLPVPTESAVPKSGMSITNNGLILEWTPVKDVDHYRIDYKISLNDWDTTKGNSNLMWTEKSDTTKDTNFRIHCEKGHIYNVKVRPVFFENESSWS